MVLLLDFGVFDDFIAWVIGLCGWCLKVALTLWIRFGEWKCVCVP